MKDRVAVAMIEAAEAAEIWRQAGGRIGVVAVQPADSAVLSGGASGAHRIDDIGAGATVVTMLRDTGKKYLSQA